MTVINIKYVNPAKDEKKYGSIVGTDQTRYMVPAGMVHQFQTGSTVDVPTKTERWGESIVTIVAGHANGSPSPPPPAPRPAPYAPAPAPSLGSGLAPVNAVPPIGTAMDKDALIFVTGLVGRSMGSGKFASGDMSDLTHEALKAWFMLKDQLRR